METARHTTVIAALTAVISGDATRPLITFYDDDSGERTELSGVTLGNWVAKTANLLADGLGLGPGDVAGVTLPPHWQTAAVLLGCWSAGLAVDLDGPAEAAPVAFTTVDAFQRHPTRAGDVFVLALAAMAAPVRPAPPPGTADYVLEVRGHADQFTARPIGPESRALADGTTHGALAERARRHGVPPGARVLIDGDATPDPAFWLVAPLVAGATVVLCRNLDPARREARLVAERATAYP